MNLEEKRIRLKNLLEDNISVGNVGTAIAITGSWGVGKTFFWNSFREQVNFKKKYVYVSLFGLESLSDLKTHIYSNIENNHSALEIPRWIRGLPSILKDTRISQFGVSASAKVFDSLMFNQVKDAIICFDDFERMSNKLDIKDVMGLANQLKLEKNCQVILILDEDKTEDENKKKYAEYKEKLIDETIIINSVESLIRANTKDMDEPLIELMVEFADELKIHNFRFFQKVIKLYKDFRKQLPSDVADSTKEIILIRILQGYLISEFSQLEYSWSDCKYFGENKRAEWSEQKKQTYESLQKISYSFNHGDEWLIEFKKWFEQIDQYNLGNMRELVQSELISEENNQKKNNFNRLFDCFWGLSIDENFPEKLYFASQQVVGFEGLHNLSFALKILEQFGEDKKVSQLENQIIEWMKLRLKANRNAFIDIASFGEVREVFHNYIKTYQIENQLKGLPSLIDVIHQYVNIQSWNSEHTLGLEYATKSDWKRVLFEQIPNDDRFEFMNSSQVVKKMVHQGMKPDLNSKIRETIIEVYKEKGQESEFYNRYMNYLISRLDN